MAQLMELVKGTLSARADNNEVVMACSIPMVQSYFNVKDLQQWLTTLEEVMQEKKNASHTHDLESIYFVFKNMLVKHQDQHEEVISSAPTADDLQSYLAYYSAAIGAIK